MAEVPGDGMPEPETEELGRYLEDTITIDWQTPAVSERARELLAGRERPEDRVRVLFEFVRDEIDHSFDIDTNETPCRASEVLAEGTGLCYAKSHLLAGLLRYAGFPTGFCYARVNARSGAGAGGDFALHGFNATWWAAGERWIFLDPRGGPPELATECRFEAPWSLAHRPDVEAGESFLPLIYKRPARRIIDLLERAPDLAAVRRNLPGSI